MKLNLKSLALLYAAGGVVTYLIGTQRGSIETARWQTFAFWPVLWFMPGGLTG